MNAEMGTNMVITQTHTTTDEIIFCLSYNSLFKILTRQLHECYHINVYISYQVYKLKILNFLNLLKQY